MAATTFQERLERIEQRNCGEPEYAPVRFAHDKAAKTARRRPPASIGKYVVTMATGGLLGILMGVLIQGAVLAESPWGPGTEYSEMLGMVGLGGLVSSLPLLLLSVQLRSRRPGLFFFAIAYAVTVIATALV